MNQQVRVRFAPSPTGPLHIGGVRTALYNYLFAKKNNGTFILRIEDTDQTRFVKGAEKYIIEAFQWLGLDFDEGVHIGGKFSPYKQSERKEIYHKYAQQLIDTGWAYYAFDTPEQLENKRKACENDKQNFQYDCNTRLHLNNSLSLSSEEVQRKLDAGTNFVIRFKFPENAEVIVTDIIRGTVKVNTNLLDDKVLYKSDGMPTYHLANIVDDHLMEISHVIRGEEWLPSTPLHVMLYAAFGWQPPQFAHLPLLLKPDGNGKLSKRDGDRLGFPVFPLLWVNPDTNEISSGYRESGYLPEAVVNMLALLGWNPGNNQEFFTINELIELFSLEKIGKAGAKFDPEKAKWFNHTYIQHKDNNFLSEILEKQLQNNSIFPPKEKINKAVSLIKERVNFLTELLEQCNYLFIPPTNYDPIAVKKRWQENTPSHLLKIIDILKSVSPFEKNIYHDLIMKYITDNQLNTGQIMNSLRLSIVGETKGIDMFEIIDFLGITEVESRINRAITEIKI